MNVRPFRTGLLSGLSAVLFGVALGCQAGPLEIDGAEPGVTAGRPNGPRHKSEAAPSRLRCWQHGVSVLDEVLAESATAPAGQLLSMPGAGGNQVVLVVAGTGLCMLTVGPMRKPA